MRKIVIENIRNIQQLSFNIPNPGLYILTGKWKREDNAIHMYQPHMQ